MVYYLYQGIALNIISYGNKETEKFDLEGKTSSRCKWKRLEKIVRRKLDILIYGHEITDFKIPLGNRFEYLKGDFGGYCSIRINDQWRIVFRINKNNQLEEVEIIDYHN